MLDHLGIQCTDLQTSAAFYDAVLAPLGAVRMMDFDVAMGYGIPPKPDFWIGAHDSGDGFRESPHRVRGARSGDGAGLLRRRRRGRCRGAARATRLARVPPRLLRRRSSATPTATTWRRSATGPKRRDRDAVTGGRARAEPSANIRRTPSCPCLGCRTVRARDAPGRGGSHDERDGARRARGCVQRRAGGSRRCRL